MVYHGDLGWGFYFLKREERYRDRLKQQHEIFNPTACYLDVQAL